MKRLATERIYVFGGQGPPGELEVYAVQPEYGVAYGI
jgi:hypothetical protein